MVKEEIKVPAVRQELDTVIGLLERLLEEEGCSPKMMIAIAIAVEEAYINIADYAYPGTRGDCTFSVCIEDGQATMILKDQGIPYDPLAKEDPDITLSADERQIGGLGIYMAKKTMDDIHYERKDEQNILTMMKRIG
ncbi:MAG: ATP-binding protein [Lachnospiraceae bacterium]|nr:ATP-binding protein [Lachnospiraceae bacterium]